MARTGAMWYIFSFIRSPWGLQPVPAADGYGDRCDASAGEPSHQSERRRKQGSPGQLHSRNRLVAGKCLVCVQAAPLKSTEPSEEVPAPALE